MNMIDMADARKIINTYDDFCEIIMGKGLDYDGAIKELIGNASDCGYSVSLANMTRQVADIQFGDMLFRLFNDSDDGFRIDGYAWYNYELLSGKVAQIKIELD